MGHYGDDVNPDDGRSGEDREERDLMLRVQADGDLDAFALLAGRYRGSLRRFLESLLPGDPALAEDGVQETLLRLWASRERWRPTGKVSSYLFGIALHWANNQRARRATRARHEHRPSTFADAPSTALEFVSPPAVTQPERVLLARWERERMTAALRTLPEGQRRVFEMSHFDGRKYAEIASLLGIPVGTVKSRMSEAVRRLRAALCETEDADDEGEYPK